CRTTACFCAGWGRACWNWEGKAARSATPWCIPGLTWNTCSGWATKRPAYTPDAVISRHALTPADIRRSFCRLRPSSRSGAEASARSGHRRLVRSGDGATGRHKSRSRGPAARRKGRSGGGGHPERAAAGGAASYAGGDGGGVGSRSDVRGHAVGKPELRVGPAGVSEKCQPVEELAAADPGDGAAAEVGAGWHRGVRSADGSVERGEV